LKEFDFMISRAQIRRTIAVTLWAALALSFLAVGARADKKKAGPASTSIDDYIKRVGGAAVDEPSTMGSLWVSSGPLAHAFADYKARKAGDLITVQLVDTFTAATNGENSTSRAFNTNSGVTGLLGQIGAKNGLSNLFAANSATTLDGKGASTMSSNLQVNLSGRVVEVMPNGILVVEAVRDFTVGNDRQTIVLRGLVRPGDITSSNTVVSSQITSMELAIKGKGAVADASAQPNIVIRTLLKLLSF
jgi:flagellar L-ring protein precursor FlgH